MIMTPARTVREAAELIDRLIPLLRGREHAERIAEVRDDLLAIRGAANDGALVPINHTHLEMMQAVVGRACLDGGLDIDHYELAADLCVAMREIGLQAVAMIV